MSGGDQKARNRAFLLDWLWPAACYGCGRINTWWCADCQLALINNWSWRDIKPPIQSNLATIKFCADYHQPLVNSLLKQTKYRRLSIPGKILADNFAQYIKQTLSQQTWLKKSLLTAIPLSRARLNWRGFNQAETLVKAIAEHIDCQLINHWQRCQRQPQAKLSRTERLSNLNGAFSWRGHLGGANIIIIDDVLTTGATLNQAADCLHQAGANRIIGLVLAH